MKRRYWTHLPAIMVLTGFIVWFLSRSEEWPSRVPLQVGWSGQVTTWGSPWLAFGIAAGLSLFFIALTALLDELWVRQESGKRFNYLSLLDELVVSLLVTIQGSSLLASARGVNTYRLAWGAIVPIVAGIVLLGVLGEWKRHTSASSGTAHVAQRSTDGFREHLSARRAAGETIVFWDIQNPKYVSWLSVGVPLVLWGSAAMLVRESLWAASLNAAIGLLLLLFYGGQRARVSAEGVTLRYGLMGIRVFRCQLSDIAGIKIRTFAPLAEFGGYGIRAGRGVTAYFLAGRTGVQLDFSSRRSVLIGSANPDRLAAVIEALSGVSVTDENEVTV